MDTDERFEAVVSVHYALIYKYCLVKLDRDDTAATQVTNDTFMILRAKLDSLDLSGNVAGWLVKTAQNCILKYKERESRYKSRVILADDDAFFERIADDGDTLEDRVIGEIAGGELAARLEASLGDAERELFRLRYIEEKNPTEIAAILGTPYTTTRMRLKRLEAKLRAVLGGEGPDERTKNTKRK